MSAEQQGMIRPPAEGESRNYKVSDAVVPITLVPKTPIKLDIGSGANRRDHDYTTVDLHHENGDIKAPMWDIPLPDNSVEAIWSEHALEHVPMSKVPETLREWYRLLKPGHRAIIQVPNFDYVAKYWLTGENRQWAEMMVFGNQMHDGEYHKCAFTAALLRSDCEAAGFKVLRVDIRWTHSQETLQAVCEKAKA